MNKRRVFVLLVALLVLVGSLPAQDEEQPRFRLPDRAPTTAELNALLKRRLDRGKDEEQVRKLVQEILKGKFDTEAIRELQKQIEQNPELKKQVESKLLNQPGLRQQVEDALKNKTTTPNQLKDLVGKLNPPRQMPPIGPRPPRPDGPPRPEVPPNVEPPRPQPMPMPPPPPPPPSPSTTDWLKNQANSMAGSWAKGLRNLDNDTLKGIVEQIQKSGLAPSKFELPEWVKNATKDVSGDLKAWLPNVGDTIGNMRPPNLGNWNVGTPSLPSAESTGTGLSVFLALGLLAIIALLVWQTRGLGYLGRVEANDRRRLGPCPVAPDLVTSRAQLVLCFEYLARKVLGQPAETSHHHETARRLGEQADTPQQQHAADELADLYEQARYLPPVEALPDEAIVRARQALRLLATVNPA